ncbi:MAG: DUF86 domain-containing protein [Gemmatimonadetes bacterium]|nr:DUF86 domain-containing protein [Gemmatimonadota bacterium]MYG85037.1 DUF86 domain-containing protein [Gemmatimonadota bacterium]MYJ89174.1 DUF86 domain-containing protein [Gemmatimonadota bacterium]
MRYSIPPRCAMSRRDDRVSLVDMRNYAVEAVDLTDGKSLNDLFEDRIRQLALLKLVETVGDAANRVSEKTKQKHVTIPWPQIIGVRNRLVHGYDAVNLDILWNIIRNDLPSLITELEDIIDEENP